MDGGDSRTKWARGRGRGSSARAKKDTRVTRPDEKCQKLQELRLRNVVDVLLVESVTTERERERRARRGAAGGEMKGETNRENETKPGGNAINRADGRRRDS